MTNNNSNSYAESTPLVQSDRDVVSVDEEGETLTTTTRRSATVRFVMLLLSATAVFVVLQNLGFVAGYSDLYTTTAVTPSSSSSSTGTGTTTLIVDTDNDLEYAFEDVKPTVDVPMPETCSAEEGKEECIPSMVVRNSTHLRTCLEDAVDAEQKVTILEYMGSAPKKEVLKVTFPEKNYKDYEEALFSAGWGFPRSPAGIFYAENEIEVVSAVNCAREAGYKISPRGRGHSFQGLSNMDGYLVIDMSLICHPGNPEDPTNPGEFEVRNSTELKEKYNLTSWIFGEDQKILGSIKSGAGCTNAVMLAYTSRHPEFAGEKGGIILVGSCPSVGITGYATGGGQGDTTPYVGLGVDDVIAYDIVLYDGRNITASQTEHPNLYWYLRGGGSGIGVITKLETVVIQSPDPEPEATRKFTYVEITYSNEEEKVKKFMTRFQDFLVPPNMAFDSPEYKEKIKKGSALFGGTGSIGVKDAPFGNPTNFFGHFLGSEEEARKVFDEYQLLDDDIGANAAFYERDSYGETQALLLCTSLHMAQPFPFWYLWVAASLAPDTKNSYTYGLDVCEDLDIDSDRFCSPSPLIPSVPEFEPYTVKLPNCSEPTVIEAFVNASLKPQSFLNRPGSEQTYRGLNNIWLELGLIPNNISAIPLSSQMGGLVMPRVEPDVLLELAKLGIDFNHLAHGAPTLIAPNATGYANREEFWLLSLQNKAHYDEATSILTNKVYGGDPAKVRGFYNYLNPLGNPHWREYYWGDNYKRLSEIKLEFDKTNGFGNPAQVEPAIPGK